ncbi:hypothetical protein AWC38_SpisGene24212 [Stylophora pistillata]|uniref:Uncharacterized protein n=1 Tax=Stylophora pistillata TaxID=50429 RepID=A0A2B4R2Q8_STYPI|nr:hypothetical protein AWC38_SpisGene24212 [Stylophora pistillata]
MGIALTDGGTVFFSSSKEHPLFSLKEEEMLGVIETLTKVCGETAGHRDGVQATKRKPWRGRASDMTIPRCTRQSFLIVLESLTSLTNTLTEIGYSHLLDRICFESMTTLGVERYFKGMQADQDMPTGAKYAYRKARCVEDDMLHIYQKDFTGPNSFYSEKIIKASLEESEDVTTACQVMDANVALRSTAVRVQTTYEKDNILAVRHNRRREISPFWLAVLLEDVQLQVNGGNFVQQRVSLK